MTLSRAETSSRAGRVGSIWSLPNVLTLLRVAAVPLIVVLLLDPSPADGLLAAVLFIAASITDYLDGYLARKWNIVTTFGKFLDPLADKLLVLSALVMLAGMPCVSAAGAACDPRVPAWVVVVIVARELTITALRTMAASEGITIGAEDLGKYKTIFQIFAIVGLLVHHSYVFVDFHALGTYFLWISVLLGLWSGVDYGVRFQRTLARTAAGGGD
jgi:CDP-diacylglycerol--glycerol-3-phosphate 3-phosphatidyltransferase